MDVKADLEQLTSSSSYCTGDSSSDRSDGFSNGTGEQKDASLDRRSPPEGEVYDVCFVFPLIGGSRAGPSSPLPPGFPLGVERVKHILRSVLLVNQRPRGHVAQQEAGGRQSGRAQQPQPGQQFCVELTPLLSGGRPAVAPGAGSFADVESDSAGSLSRSLSNVALPEFATYIVSPPAPPTAAPRATTSPRAAAADAAPDDGRRLANSWHSTVTRDELYSGLRRAFVAFLINLGCIYDERIIRDHIFIRVRLREAALMRLARRMELKLQLDERTVAAASAAAAVAASSGAGVSGGHGPASMPAPLTIPAGTTATGVPVPYLSCNLMARRRRATITTRSFPEGGQASGERNRSREMPSQPSEERTPGEASSFEPTAAAAGHGFQLYDLRGNRLPPGSLNATSFRPVDRIRMTMFAVSRSFDLEAMHGFGILSADYPLHEPLHYLALYECWGAMRTILAPDAVSQQPVEAVRNYFGEEIGFYFAWVGRLNMALRTPAILGLAVLVCQLLASYTCFVDARFANVVNLVFALYITSWGKLHLRAWETEENVRRLRWGVSEAVATGPPRRERAQYRTSLIARCPRAGAACQLVRRLLSAGISIVYMSCTLLYVGLVFAAPWIAAQYPLTAQYVDLWVAPALRNPLFTLCNILFVTTLDRAWNWLAEKLTLLENWRFESDFRRALILKLYVFRFVNHFNSLFFLAFMRNPLSLIRRGGRRAVPASSRDTAVSLLRWNIITMMSISVINNFQEVGLPIMSYLWAGCRVDQCHPRAVGASYIGCRRRYRGRRHRFYAAAGAAAAAADTSAATNSASSQNSFQNSLKSLVSTHSNFEREFALSEFDGAHGLLEEYLEIVFIYGFVVMFSAVLAAVPALAWAATLVELRVDAFKLTRFFRRPYPSREPEGVNTWKDGLRVTCDLAILTNLAMIIFPLGLGEALGLTFVQKLLLFVCAEHVAIAIPSVLRFLTPETDDAVEVTRQQMSALLHNTLFGDDEVLQEQQIKAALIQNIPEQLHPLLNSSSAVGGKGDQQTAASGAEALGESFPRTQIAGATDVGRRTPPKATPRFSALHSDFAQR